MSTTNEISSSERSGLKCSVGSKNLIRIHSLRIGGVVFNIYNYSIIFRKERMHGGRRDACDYKQLSEHRFDVLNPDRNILDNV